MVGHQTLDLGAVVRAHLPQPFSLVSISRIGAVAHSTTDSCSVRNSIQSLVFSI